MTRDVMWFLLCLWIASLLSRKGPKGNENPSAWQYAKRSLRWGVVLVTIPLLGYLGAVRFIQGVGIPSVFSLVLCVGITAVVLLGAKVRVSGNVVLDSLLLSTGLVAACFTVLNGLPEVRARLSAENVYFWFLACTCMALVVRTFFWIKEAGR